jgi:hypothetical protein
MRFRPCITLREDLAVGRLYEVCGERKDDSGYKPNEPAA